MKSFIKKFNSFRNNEQGSVLIMVAAFILVMIAISGAAVDFGRAQLVQMKKQQAADMATLAAAYIIPEFKEGDNGDEIIRDETAIRYYNLNFPANYLGVTRKPITPDTSTRDITVATTDDIVPTNYINTSGISGLKVGADTKVNMPDKDFPDFDVTVVVDESGSTKELIDSSKTIIAAEKSAIISMLDILFPDGQDANPNLRFGLVGYTGAIMQASPLTSVKSDAVDYVTSLGSYSQNYDHWGLEAGFNVMTPPWKGFLPPLHCGIGVYEPIPNCIPNIVTDPNNTNAPKSGYCMRTVDGLPPCIPQRNTSAPEPATVRTKIIDGKIDLVSPSKHMVLISDGYIMQEPSPCQQGNNYHNKGNWGKPEWPEYVDEEVATKEEIDAANASGKCKNYLAFTNMCSKIKNARITLHVISFISLDPDDEDSLEACATTPNNYHYAPTESVLRSILTGIATQVKQIRITD